MEDAKRQALLLEVHEAIREQAELLTKQLCGDLEAPSISYPPGAELTGEELAALKAMNLPDSVAPAIQKLAADAMSSAFFRFFSVLDAVGDPVHHDGEWLPLTLTESPDDEQAPMWHHDHFETYWTWHESRTTSTFDE